MLAVVVVASKGDCKVPAKVDAASFAVLPLGMPRKDTGGICSSRSCSGCPFLCAGWLLARCFLCTCGLLPSCSFLCARWLLSIRFLGRRLLYLRCSSHRTAAAACRALLLSLLLLFCVYHLKQPLLFLLVWHCGSSSLTPATCSGGGSSSGHRFLRHTQLPLGLPLRLLLHHQLLLVCLNPNQNLSNLCLLFWSGLDGLVSGLHVLHFDLKVSQPLELLLHLPLDYQRRLLDRLQPGPGVRLLQKCLPRHVIMLLDHARPKKQRRSARH